MNDWIDPTTVEVPDSFLKQLGVSQFLSELLVSRGFTDINAALGFLYPDQYQPSSFSELPGIDAAVDIIAKTIKKKLPILVWGDFDVDGQTATTVLTDGLRTLGAEVQHYIPVRKIESHGVHINRLDSLTGKEGLLITCDTGISAHEAVSFANGKGLSTIITDHHELPDKLPDAQAIISSRLVPKEHSLSALPGVGVAYKLIEALFDHFNHPDPEKYLDLAALGIVADVAELVMDTRFLLQLGIQKLRQTTRIGLLALYEQAGVLEENIDAEQIGFGLAPRLNALGRLGDANPIVDFFTTDDRTRARLFAVELEAINAQRRLLTDQVYHAALSLLDRNPEWANDPAIVVAFPDWPGGIIGIVASRLADTYRKPVVVISTEAGLGRGSARSIPGINITKAIASQKEILISFGGHPMAGGLGILPEHIDKFRRGFADAVQKQKEQLPEQERLKIDSWVRLDQITLDVAQEIYQLAPFGPGNPPVILAAKDIRIQSHRKIGRNGEHLRLTITDQNEVSQPVTWWQGVGKPLPNSIFDLAFTIQPSNYQGEPGIELTWLEARETNPVELEIPRTKDRTLIDLRQEIDPRMSLLKWTADKEHLVWCEGLPCPVETCQSRTEIRSIKNLIVWTSPPNRKLLSQVIDAANPETIIFFAVDPELDRPSAFLVRLARLVRAVLQQAEGITSIEYLAAQTSQDEATIRAAINLLHARGDIDFTSLDENQLHLRAGTRIADPYSSQQFEQKVRYLLSETAAFRKFYRNADLKRLTEKPN